MHVPHGRFHGVVVLFVSVFFLMGCASMKSQSAASRALTADDFVLYRHGEIKTGRPFAFDIDKDGVLWQGNTGAFWLHDLRTGKASTIAPPELKDLALSSVICFRDKIVVVHQTSDYATAYDPATKKVTRIPLPGKHPIVWYGGVIAGKLFLFDRSDDGGVLIFDAIDKPPRKIAARDGKFPSGGRAMGDGRAMLSTYPNKTFQIFDPVAEKIVDEIPYPDQDVSITGTMFHEGVMYCTDSSGGRILPCDLKTKRWLDPIPTPDHKKVYGFLGGGFQVGSVGYFCLSTYAYQSKLDPATGKLILPPNADIGIDGKPHHFLDRFLTFDAATKKFGYLVAPKQSDGYPLICYSLVKGDDVIITGYVIPFDKNGDLAKELGDWIVWQARGAKRQ